MTYDFSAVMLIMAIIVFLWFTTTIFVQNKRAIIMKQLMKLLGVLVLVLSPMQLFGQPTHHSNPSPAGIMRGLTYVSVDYDYQTRTLMIMVDNAAGVCRSVELKMKITDYASGEEVFSAKEIIPCKMYVPLMSSGLFKIVISLSSGEFYEAWIDTAWYKETGVGYERF